MLIFSWLSPRLLKGGRRAVQALVVFGLALPAALLVPAMAEPTHLIIASEGARPPYNYFDGDKLSGFEIDLGTDLCKRMAVSCTFVAQDWDSMIAGLLAHHYDAVMAAMEITDERKAKIAFTLPYVRMPSAFMVKNRSGLTSDDPKALAGKRIGVEKSGTHETFLLDKYPDSTVRRYATLSDAILDLEADRVDAVIGDKDAITVFLKTRSDARCCHILADVPRDPAVFGDGIGVGLRKEDAALKASFEKALASCVADGTFAAISAKYFDFPIN
ncbi:transporter substrate-binding domain-containing protein [Beijerinckia sp. L45]|uniref:transporter substrate-binding domain-containing protein n=1 Tax=Beijerinckia sp. L45 TaxID=1641855 RepID=UPI00131EAF00|nr:transporter substrate-binding domain-containing protein [Beijerinckia sp. L45]